MAQTAAALVRRRGRWLRRPTIEEVATVSSPAPSSAVFPSIDVYQDLTVPLLLVLASDGLYVERREDVRAAVSGGADRRLVELESNHNVPMTRPRDLTRVLLEHLDRDRVRVPGGPMS